MEALNWLNDPENDSVGIKIKGQPVGGRGKRFVHALYAAGADRVGVEFVDEGAPDSNDVDRIVISLHGNPLNWKYLYGVMAIVALAHPEDIDMECPPDDESVIITVAL